MARKNTFKASLLERLLAREALLYDDLPRPWKLPEERLRRFSARKKLFGYQREALRRTSQLLYLYFSNWREQRSLKARFFRLYREEGFDPSPFHHHEFKSKKAKKASEPEKLFEIYSEHFPVMKGGSKGHYIDAREFLNRACYWMATGSGKSLVLIKVIELLDQLMREGLVPRRELLLLVPRDELMEQYKKHFEEYNADDPRRPIHHCVLTDYNKEGSLLRNEHAINVFYYRSDLLRDERKDKTIDYRDYLNPEDAEGSRSMGTNDQGTSKWYVFLDEAHIGKQDDSKRQAIAHAMSRDGFLFNFSATFVEELDYLTTCFNFNLERFIGEGYGKRLYIDPTQMDAFKNDKARDFSNESKRRQVLKSLLILAAIRSSRKADTYHDPLMVVFTNKVSNQPEKLSDLWMFFEELVRIAGEEVPEDLLETLKQECLQDGARAEGFVYGKNHEDKFQDALREAMTNMDMSILRRMVFNSSDTGRLEYQEGEQGKEIVLKLETAEEPFGLINIGNTSKYVQSLMERGYVRTRTPVSEKVFGTLENDDSPITMLMGSRKFYMGWDSNRPNVMNFINIGMNNAKKFSVQALGRGVRIQPNVDPNIEPSQGSVLEPDFEANNSRKRLPLGHKDKNPLMETLYVFATDKLAMEVILENKKNEASFAETRLEVLPEKNPEIEKAMVLLIPKYETSNDAKRNKFAVKERSLERFKTYMRSQDESLLVLKHVRELAPGPSGSSNADLRLRRLLELRDPKTQGNLLEKKPEGIEYQLMNEMFSHLMEFQTMERRVLDGVEEMPKKKAIVHFKEITVSPEDPHKRGLEEAITKTLPSSEAKERRLKEQRQAGEIGLDEYTKNIKALVSTSKAEYCHLVLEKCMKHYYCPLIYKRPDVGELSFKVRNVVSVESESLFLEALIKAVADDKIDLGKGTHWFFSKMVDRVDHVKIPYTTRMNEMRNFYPDFVFWVWNEKEYRIIFVDPKGTEHRDYEIKVKGYEEFFRKDGDLVCKEFSYKNFRKVTVDLKFVAAADKVKKYQESKYKDYWTEYGRFDFLKI